MDGLIVESGYHMETNFVTYIIVKTVLDIVAISLIVVVLYLVVYSIKLTSLEKWVMKAVVAAEEMFVAPKHSKEYSKEKKEWVISFLKDNGLTVGVPPYVVDKMIESAVRQLNSPVKCNPIIQNFKSNQNL